VIVNALGPQFHKGLEPSRYGRPGRVPGSVNVPAATLADPAQKAFTTLADAEAKFRAQGVTADKRVICYCGGGISATIDLFVLHQLGYGATVTLYDEVMGEWRRIPVRAEPCAFQIRVPVDAVEREDRKVEGKLRHTRDLSEGNSRRSPRVMGPRCHSLKSPTSTRGPWTSVTASSAASKASCSRRSLNRRPK
jgi:rhodanese-related sulfurtransferase